MPLFSQRMPAFGIDLSDLSVKVAQVKKKGDKLILTSLGQKTLPQGLIDEGVIQNEKEVIENIKKATSEVRGQRIKTKYIVCSLPEEKAFIKTIKIPRAEKKEIGEMIKWQIEPNFPVKLDDVYFDWRKVEPFEKIGKEIQKKQSGTEVVSIAVISKEIVDSYLSVFKKAGFQPIVFEIESMSVVRSLIPGSLSSYPVIILDMGKCGTGLTIFSGKTILFTTHIGLGGRDLDKAIAQKLKVSEDEAERLKKEIGLINIRKKWRVYRIPIVEKSSKRAISESKFSLLKRLKEDEIFDALEPILTNLVEQVKHFVEFFKDFGRVEYVPDGIIREVILCGGEANLIGLCDFLSSSLKLKVRLGNPLINISKCIFLRKKETFSQKQSLAFSTAIGLAIRGAK